MRSLAFFSAILVSLCQLNLIRANDNLFSQVAMESVFATSKSENSSIAVAQPESDQKLGRIMGTNALVKIIRGAELNCTVKGERVNLVLESAGWRFPVALTVDVDRERILCDLTLNTIKQNAKIDPDRVLQLMAAGDASQSAFFAYDTTQRCIQLRGWFSNRNVNSKELIVELERMGRIAASQSSHWTHLDSEVDSVQSGQGGQSTGASSLNIGQRTPAKDHSLEGRWSASLSNSEAFALQVDRGNRFSLVYVKDGKSNTSTGIVERNGGDLVLKEDSGTSLTCEITWRDANTFQLVIKTTNGKAGLRMALKKR